MLHPWSGIHNTGERLRNRTGRDGRRGVGASHSIVEAGEPPEGPRGEKGTPCHDTVGGKHGGCIETLNRANKTTTDRGVGTRRTADSLSVPPRSELMM